MRIAIDVSQVVYGTGVSSYVKNLVSSLLAIDKKNDYLLIGGAVRRRKDLNKFFNSLEPRKFKTKQFSISPSMANFIWNKIHILPIEFFTGKIDVFHSSDWTQPPSSAYKVTTVHDLVPIKYPEVSHPKIVSAHQARLAWVKKEVNKIIVPSETTKLDLNQIGIDLDRIVVIPEAPDPSFKPEKKSKIIKIKKKYHIKGDYLLAIGTAPRKNNKRIIETHKQLKTKYDLDLVIVGQQLIEVMPENGVKFLGHVLFEELPALYSGAKALVYPSLYEGFGLPILEAFACKVPVITSNLGSLKEIAQDAAVLVNPGSTDSIVDGIEKTLKYSETFVKKGVKRVKIFNWERNARETLKIYINNS